MKNLKTALFGLVFALVLVSCKSEDTPEPVDTEQYKVEVVNEGATQDFTQQMYISVSGTGVLDAEITGAVWDDISVSEGDQWSDRRKSFSKKSDVPSAVTYKTADELSYMRYLARIEAKEGTESTMKTKITFYRAGKRVSEKNFTISGKGGELVIDYHDDYDMFDLYQPL